MRLNRKQHHIHLASKTCLGDLHQIVYVVFGKGDLITDLVKFCNSDLASFVVAIGDSDRMNTLVNQLRCLFQERSSQNHYTSCSITDFIVLGFRKFDEKFGDVV